MFVAGAMLIVWAVGVTEDAAPRRPSGATLLTVIEIIAAYVPQYRRQLGSFSDQCELFVVSERIQVNTSGQGIDVVVVADLVAIQNSNLYRVVRLEDKRQFNKHLQSLKPKILILET